MPADEVRLAEDAAADPEEATADEAELAADEADEADPDAVDEAEPDWPNREAPFVPTIPPDTPLPATERPAFAAAEL